MRPRKHVLLYCADEHMLSLVGFVLEARLQIKLWKTRKAEDVIWTECDAAVVYRTNSPEDKKALALGSPVEVLAGQIGLGYGLKVEGHFPQNCCELLEAVKQAASRKRGPKPLARAA